MRLRAPSLALAALGASLPISAPPVTSLLATPSAAATLALRAPEHSASIPTGPASLAKPAISANPASGDTITIARVRYDGGGDWYADPTSLSNLLLAIRTRTGIPVSSRETVVRPLDPALSDSPYLYMTGHGDVRFSPQERAALRAHLEAGGFLHVDDNYGLDESFREELLHIFPETELTEIPPDHPVFHAFYSFPDGLPKIHEHDGEPPQAFGIFLNGRLALFYSFESDLGDGWEDSSIHGDSPELREAAVRMGVNLFVYALGQTVRRP